MPAVPFYSNTEDSMLYLSARRKRQRFIERIETEVLPCIAEKFGETVRSSPDQSFEGFAKVVNEYCGKAIGAFLTFVGAKSVEDADGMLSGLAMFSIAAALNDSLRADFPFCVAVFSIGNENYFKFFAIRNAVYYPSLRERPKRFVPDISVRSRVSLLTDKRYAAIRDLP